MNVGGMMSGKNTMLDSVMASQSSASGGSYTERSMNGRKTATAMQQKEMGKSAVSQMRLQVEDTEESIEEQTEKALAEKKAAEAAEAQRVAKKGQGSAASPAQPGTGDTVEISEEGKAAAQALAAAGSAASAAAPAPAEAPASAPAPAVDAAPAVETAAPAASAEQSTAEAPQVDVTV